MARRCVVVSGFHLRGYREVRGDGGGRGYNEWQKSIRTAETCTVFSVCDDVTYLGITLESESEGKGDLLRCYTTSKSKLIQHKKILRFERKDGLPLNPFNLPLSYEKHTKGNLTRYEDFKIYL